MVRHDLMAKIRMSLNESFGQRTKSNGAADPKGESLA
jgi:hypothetical protein